LSKITQFKKQPETRVGVANELLDGLLRLCFLHLLTLGSFMVEKRVKIDEFAVFSVIAGLYFQKFPQNLPKINNF